MIEKITSIPPELLSTLKSLGDEAKNLNQPQITDLVACTYRLFLFTSRFHIGVMEKNERPVEDIAANLAYPIRDALQDIYLCLIKNKKRGRRVMDAFVAETEGPLFYDSDIYY